MSFLNKARRALVLVDLGLQHPESKRVIMRRFTLEYSCANLLYFVCRSVTFAMVADNLIPFAANS